MRRGPLDRAAFLSARIALLRVFRRLQPLFGRGAHGAHGVRRLQPSAQRATSLTFCGDSAGRPESASFATLGAARDIADSFWKLLFTKNHRCALGRRLNRTPSVRSSPNAVPMVAMTESSHAAHSPASPPYRPNAVVDLRRCKSFIERRSDAGGEFGPGPGLG